MVTNKNKYLKLKYLKLKKIFNIFMFHIICCQSQKLMIDSLYDSDINLSYNSLTTILHKYIYYYE